MCRVAWQTHDWTPLFIASQNGHVECVRVLLDRGAAINHSTVGSTSSIARHRGALWEPACSRAFAAGWLRLEGLAMFWIPCRSLGYGEAL